MFRNSFCNDSKDDKFPEKPKEPGPEDCCQVCLYDVIPRLSSSSECLNRSSMSQVLAFLHPSDDCKTHVTSISLALLWSLKKRMKTDGRTNCRGLFAMTLGSLSVW